MAPTLIACPSCACHAKSTESTCPSCGEPLRRKDGSLPRAAVAVFLGLTTATAGLSACSSTTSGGEGGSATTSSSTGPSAAYGIAQTTASSSSSSSSGPATAYGVAQTTSSSSGGTGGKDGG